MPRAVAKREVNTNDLEVKQPDPRLQSATGPASLTPDTTDAGERVTVKSRIDPEWMANMAFNKELITIRVDESTDENAEKFVEVWNNGDYMKFERGKETTCERRFVETLMRAKPTKFSQKAVLDDLGKVGAYQEIPHRALRYHFAVVRDDNPNGPTWLKSVLAQA